MPEVLRLKSGTIGELAQQGQIEVVASKEPEKETVSDFSELRQFFGKNFLGPQEVEATFGVRIAPERVPAVPFTRSELERAKILNQRLVLRVDKAPDGSPLTMAKMEEVLRDRFQREGKGKVICRNAAWYEEEPLFTTETPRTGWALVSNEPLPGSLSKNYFQQTEVLAAYIQNDLFKRDPLPTQFWNAVVEFTSRRQSLRSLLKKNRPQAARELTTLTISRFRPKPVEVLYDLIMYLQSNGERLLSDNTVWTDARASDFDLIHVGYFDTNGLHLNFWPPGNKGNTHLGIWFSRRT